MEANYVSGPESDGGMVPVLPPQSLELDGEQLMLKFTLESDGWWAAVSDVQGRFSTGYRGATPALAVQSVFEFLARVPHQCPWRFAPYVASGGLKL